jgi:hypothetical protein
MRTSIKILIKTTCKDTKIYPKIHHSSYAFVRIGLAPSGCVDCADRLADADGAPALGRIINLIKE